MKRIFCLGIALLSLVALTSVAFGENLKFAIVYPIVHPFSMRPPEVLKMRRKNSAWKSRFLARTRPILVSR